MSDGSDCFHAVRWDRMEVLHHHFHFLKEFVAAARHGVILTEIKQFNIFGWVFFDGRDLFVLIRICP